MMVKTVDLPQTTRVAVLVIAISAGAPMVPRRLLGAGGDPRYVLSLAVTSSVLAILTVPLSVAALSRIFGVTAGVDPTAVAGLIAKSFLLPFLAGVAVHAYPAGHRRSHRRAGDNGRAGRAGRVPGHRSRGLDRAGDRKPAALVPRACRADVHGHPLRPSPGRAQSGGSRVARRPLRDPTRRAGDDDCLCPDPSRGALAVISAYVIAALLVSTPYVMWSRKRLQALAAA